MTIHLPAETALALAIALTDVRYDLHAKRNAAEAAIDDLIQFLDDTEGDTDLELNGDERDASYPEGWRHLYSCENEDDEHGGDDELSLGSPEMPPETMLPGGRYGWHRVAGNQEKWADRGAGNDGEVDGGDAPELVNEDGGDVLDEPHDVVDEGNDEWPLGWSHDVDQCRAAMAAPSGSWEIETEWEAA